MQRTRIAIATAAAATLCLALAMVSPSSRAASSRGTALPSVPLRTVSMMTAGYSAMAYTPHGNGHWLASAAGGVTTSGSAKAYGSLAAHPPPSPIVAMAATPHGNGYWLASATGGVYSFGSAKFYGSMGATHLNQPIVGMAAVPGGSGYWLVAADGGIFSFGTAAFHGSTGNLHLNKPIVGMASTPHGHGYWLVASDGGVFAFGSAKFYGSMGGHPLAQPVAGMAAAPAGQGYWLVAADGGIFSFGDAPFLGSMAGKTGGIPVVGIAATPTGTGYAILSTAGVLLTTSASSTTGTPAPQPSPPTAPPLSLYPPAATLGTCYTSVDQPISCNTVSEQQLQAAVGDVISGRPITMPSAGQSGIVPTMAPSATTAVTSTGSVSLFTDTVNLQTYAGFPDPLNPGHGLWSSADIEGATVSATVPTGCHLAGTPAPTSATGDTTIYYWCTGSINPDDTLGITANQMPWVESAPGGNSQIVLRSQPVSTSGTSSTDTGTGSTGTTSTSTPSTPPLSAYDTGLLWIPGYSCQKTTDGVSTTCPTITQQDLTTVAGKQYPQSTQNNNTWLYPTGVQSSAANIQADRHAPQVWAAGGRLDSPPTFWTAAIGVHIVANDIPDPLDPGHLLWDGAGIQGITATVAVPPGCTLQGTPPPTGPNGDTVVDYYCPYTSNTPPAVPVITFHNVPQIENLANGNFQLTMGSQQLLASQLQTL